MTIDKNPSILGYPSNRHAEQFKLQVRIVSLHKYLASGGIWLQHCIESNTQSVEMHPWAVPTSDLIRLQIGSGMFVANYEWSFWRPCKFLSGLPNPWQTWWFAIKTLVNHPIATEQFATVRWYTARKSSINIANHVRDSSPKNDFKLRTEM